MTNYRPKSSRAPKLRKGGSGGGGKGRWPCSVIVAVPVTLIALVCWAVWR